MQVVYHRSTVRQFTPHVSSVKWDVCEPWNIKPLSLWERCKGCFVCLFVFRTISCIRSLWVWSYRDHVWQRVEIGTRYESSVWATVLCFSRVGTDWTELRSIFQKKGASLCRNSFFDCFPNEPALSRDISGERKRKEMKHSFGSSASQFPRTRNLHSKITTTTTTTTIPIDTNKNESLSNGVPFHFSPNARKEQSSFDFVCVCCWFFPLWKGNKSPNIPVASFLSSTTPSIGWKNIACGNWID